MSADKLNLSLWKNDISEHFYFNIFGNADELEVASIHRSVLGAQTADKLISTHMLIGLFIKALVLDSYALCLAVRDWELCTVGSEDDFL